ncbi:MAG: XdhC family protein [Actinobacteria bacterium]|nr:XdhC family protein [Actinomycetota bacterium]
MSLEVLQLAGERARRGDSFVLATVVWRRAPSSGKEGSRALIDPDGTVHGFLGGACAEPAVVREAIRVLEEGEPRLMFLGPESELEGRRLAGMVTVPIACQSDGALEIYLEPITPTPHLVLVGRSPAVLALARMADALAWRTQMVDGPDLSEASVGSASLVVIASQGHYDEPALEAALATDARYVALVASRRRAEAVVGYLRQRGLPEETLARVRAPAGLDLGRIAHEEIAVAVLAELVQLRAAGALGPEGSVGAAREEARDPICGMTVDVATARYRSERDGQTRYFCCAGCQTAFEAELTPPTTEIAFRPGRPGPVRPHS